MGKDEDASPKEDEESSTTSKEELTPAEKTVEDNDKNSNVPSDSSPKMADDNTEDKPAEKTDVDNLRKIIKVGGDDTKESEEKPLETDTETPDKEDVGNDSKDVEKKPPVDLSEDLGNAPGDRESLEQKRAILQSIKDFDFQIKKNQEDINNINQKLDSLSKDLDDLVSLYEIVSEQMNPFVGLSKVTKKRLDALENFTKEIELLKERTGELESFAERSGAKLKRISEGEIHAQTIDTDSILGDDAVDENEAENNSEESSDEMTEETQLEQEEEVIAAEPSSDVENQGETIDRVIVEEQDAGEIERPIQSNHQDEDIFESLPRDELDRILDEILDSPFPYGAIDMIINEFIENLKA